MASENEIIPSETDYLVIAKIGAPYGVRGWVKVFSFTEPADNLLDYDPWYFKAVGVDGKIWTIAPVTEAKTHGKAFVAKFKGSDDRNAATRLNGQEIAICRDQLPPAAEGEYYWKDLQGLEVLTTEGVSLGKVDHLLETGANDVLVVKGERERLIPYVTGPIVKNVDLDAGTLHVDWDADFE